MVDTAGQADFVHLRVHTAYSLLEGALKVKELVGLCREAGMPALAMTDTANLFGALEFSVSCAEQGVQPIIGCQLNLVREKGGKGGEDPHGHGGAGGGGGVPGEPDQIVLLVQDGVGYGNLLALVSQSHMAPDGEAGVVQVSLASLEARAEGLIALSGGPRGGVGRLLGEGQLDAAEALLKRLAAAFPGRLYVELQRHGLPAEQRIEEALLDLAYAYDLPLLATNECFFATADMFEAHDALICIAEGAYVGQSGRRRLTPDHRFKSAAEMRALFSDLPEALDNTLVVARRCAFMAEPHEPMLPSTSDAGKEAGELAGLARAGLDARLENDVPGGEKEDVARPYRERLDYELGVIGDMGFPGYFLIVADFVRWAKAAGIPVGPGRGSGAGSVVAWSLTITDLDPLRFGLLFERFLNPERVSMPDFDIDFCQDRRDEVIHYVQDKYGEDKVAQIITFGTLQPRAALRDVGRVLQMPYPQVDRICKLVPNNPAAPVTLAQAIKGEPQLQNAIAEDETVARLAEIAGRLEGLYRHASTHAAGVVIGDRPLVELIPLYRDPRSTTPVTQFAMKWAEMAGLVKFDFLGLKTLTVLETALALLAERHIQIDLAHIPFDDAPTFAMLGHGDTTGVFQLESSGMRDILRNMKPDSFEDIIAIVALFRPGPMDNIPSYIRRKHGDEEPDYLYPTLEGILTETYGIMIYQEQVMQIAQELAGYTLGGADLLRRAMGKKIQSEMDAQRKTFVDGAMARGVPERKASDIFDQVDKFAGYGFNKSHAAAYALVAYQTAYLKANYPVEFLAASMTLDLSNTDKLATFRQELKRLDISLLGPDIGASDAAFKVEMEGGKGAIRYALAAIKNVGEAAMAELVRERAAGGAYADIHDFAARLGSKVINKRQLENLVRAGAFDCFGANRRRIFDGIEAILRHAQSAEQDRQSNQIGLFGDDDAFSKPIALPEIEDWPGMERLKAEFDAIGFYLSAHPMDAYGGHLKKLRVKTHAELLEAKEGGAVRLAGSVIARKERISAKGTRYAFVQLTDPTGDFEITVFAEGLAAWRDILEPGTMIFVKGSAQIEGESLRIVAQSVERLDDLAGDCAAGLKVFVDQADPLPTLNSLLAGENAGRGEVVVISRLDPATEVEIHLPGGYTITPAMAQAVKAIPGVIEVVDI